METRSLEKYNKCNHFLINNSKEDEKINASCIKCGIEQNVLTKGLLFGIDKLSEEEKTMYISFMEKYPYYDPAYFIPGKFYPQIKMKLEDARKIYDELRTKNPSLSDDEVCELFLKVVLKKECKFDRSILEKEYPELNITKETIESIKSNPSLYLDAPLKTFIGKIYTTEEFTTRSDSLISKELPNEKVRKRNK